jgi:hypothetical protein
VGHHHAFSATQLIFGVPNQIRTGIAAVKGESAVVISRRYPWHASPDGCGGVARPITSARKVTYCAFKDGLSDGTRPKISYNSLDLLWSRRSPFPPPRPVFVRRVRLRTRANSIALCRAHHAGEWRHCLLPASGLQRQASGRTERRFAFNACPAQLTQPGPKTLTGRPRLAGLSSRAIQASCKG